LPHSRLLEYLSEPRDFLSTKGTGLGLWISKGIVQKYGGTIRLHSASLTGRNITCFQIVLPDVGAQSMEEAGSKAPGLVEMAGAMDDCQ
jgi:K+-sensing histidine kinase KdpD